MLPENQLVIGTAGGGVAQIEARAFYGCTALKDLVLEESVISVGSRPLGFATNTLKVCGVGTTTVTVTSKIAGADGKTHRQINCEGCG